MSVQLTNCLDEVTNTAAMSPITSYPQSAGEAEPFSTRAKRAGSPQRISNGYTSTKSNGILSPRKTSKRFFRRPTLEKSPSIDVTSVQGNDKRKQSTTQPKVEIIYRDSPQSENESEESNIAVLKKTFENDGSPHLRPLSTHSGERTPSTISDDSVPSALLGVQGVDVNMNRISTGSSTCSHTERVVQEIFSTEQAYVQHLHEIIEGYLKKMRGKESPFPEQDVKDLFMNIEEIYELNKEFLAELEECGDDPVDVASHFVSNEKGFKTYTDYCTNYPVSMEVLTKSTQQKETADFIKKIQVQLGHSLPLGAYLLKPVQRILKYHLLLQDIQKHFDKESCPEGYEVISDALSAMTGVAHHINEMKRQHEVAVHVQEIQSQMSDFEGPDLTTYGNLVLEDSFRLHGTKTDRYLFLFEKILLITKRKENGYSCKATLKLSNMMLLESVPKEPLAFVIIRFDNQKIQHTLLARNADQKHTWTLELKGLIVDSLSASVPKKAKALILGKENLEDKRESGTSEGKKKKASFNKGSRGRPQIKRTTLVKRKPEKSWKSDEENEPRSPSDAYSSDDDKKPIRPPSLLSDREEDLEECDETTENDTGLSPEPNDVRTGELEQGLSCDDLDEEEKEEKSEDAEVPSDQATTYSVQDAQGEVLGTATTASESVSAVTQDVKKRDDSEKEQVSSEKDTSQENKVKRTPPVLRKRSSSLSKCEALQRIRNQSLTAEFDDGAASERASFVLSRARSDSPVQLRRTSSGHRLLEARLSTEKSSSACDLRSIEEDSPSVFSCSEITSLQDYSAITSTVRKVSRAFSFSSSPAEKGSSSETQMRAAQTQYIVESHSSPDKSTSYSSSGSPHNNLEELLASIDRDLDETRRTISSAQLLESALLVKNDGRPLATECEPTDSLRRRRRQRIIDFSAENSDSRSNESNINSIIRTIKGIPNEPESRKQDETDISLQVSQKLNRAVVSDFLESASVDREQEIVCQKESNLSEPVVPQVNHAGAEAQEDQGEPSPRKIENLPMKKRVFELFADSNGEKGKQLRNVDRESSESDPEHVITPRRSTLPNVYQMARQYSKLVSDKHTVEEIRMRNRSKLRNNVGSITFENSEEETKDHTPKIKVEKITKVSFTSTPIESYKLVRRRRRRSGSRQRSDEFRRQSWSVEKVKPDSEVPRKERPKSVYDMEALEATLAENLEQIEEGLEPMLIEGLDKDDVVVRGLVQHLVNQFSQKNNKT